MVCADQTGKGDTHFEVLITTCNFGSDVPWLKSAQTHLAKFMKTDRPQVSKPEDFMFHVFPIKYAFRSTVKRL